MSPAEDDPQRILIVDDEPAVREALQRSLAFEGYGTEVAVDGLDALAKADGVPARPDRPRHPDAEDGRAHRGPPASRAPAPPRPSSC